MTAKPKGHVDGCGCFVCAAPAVGEDRYRYATELVENDALGCPAPRILLDRVERTPGGCWQWTAGLNSYGYATRRINYRTTMIHRLTFEVMRGAIPKGLQIDHLCRNRACVNPDHLEPVTVRENLMRGDTHAAANAAKTHCKHGHEFSEENTHIDKLGKRCCRACRRDISRRYADRQKAAA